MIAKERENEKVLRMVLDRWIATCFGDLSNSGGVRTTEGTLEITRGKWRLKGWENREIRETGALERSGSTVSYGAVAGTHLRCKDRTYLC